MRINFSSPLAYNKVNCTPIKPAPQKVSFGEIDGDWNDYFVPQDTNDKIHHHFDRMRSDLCDKADIIGLNNHEFWERMKQINADEAFEKRFEQDHPGQGGWDD